jgi:hypothetical protein
MKRFKNDSAAIRRLASCATAASDAPARELAYLTHDLLPL